MSDSDTRARNLDAVTRAFVAIGRQDADAMMDNYTDDVWVEFPFADPPSRMEGNANIRKYLKGAFKVFQFELTITEVHEGLDPDKLIVEFTSDGKITTTGKHYANRYIAVYGFRDGKIAWWKEYLNPKIMDAAMTP